MITNLTNEEVWHSKRNWIDQNGVVFGYDDMQDCCEEWGWGVYNPKTGEKVADEPSGLPYHFDFDRGANELMLTDHDRHKSFCKLNSEEYVDQLDTVCVYLLPDDGEGDELVFEAYTDHNGYYLHNFSLEKQCVDGDAKGGAE